MKLVGLMMALIASTALSQEKGDDHTVLVGSEDKEMLSAIQLAQDTLDEFLSVFEKPPQGASGFKLKVRIEDSGGVEHFWVTPFKKTRTGFEGIISNEPEYVHSVRFGKKYRFARNDISDWGYELNGKQKGSFTVCVMFKHMPKEEVDTYRKDYGFEC